MAVFLARTLENVRVGEGGGGDPETGYAIWNAGGNDPERRTQSGGGGRGVAVLFVRTLENVRGRRDPERGTSHAHSGTGGLRRGCGAAFLRCFGKCKGVEYVSAGGEGGSTEQGIQGGGGGSGAVRDPLKRLAILYKFWGAIRLYTSTRHDFGG